MSASAVRRCALGAVVAAAHELTHDLGAAHDFAFKALRPRQRHEGSCSRAFAVR